jgi:hypothetical protein
LTKAEELVGLKRKWRYSNKSGASMSLAAKEAKAAIYDETRTDDFIKRVRVNQQRLTAELKPHYDFIVCRSGSSGSVVARRLADIRQTSPHGTDVELIVPSRTAYLRESCGVRLCRGLLASEFWPETKRIGSSVATRHTDSRSGSLTPRRPSGAPELLAIGIGPVG